MLLVCVILLSAFASPFNSSCPVRSDARRSPVAGILLLRQRLTQKAGSTMSPHLRSMLVQLFNALDNNTSGSLTNEELQRCLLR